MIKYLSVIALCSFIHYSECMSIRNLYIAGSVNSETFRQLYDQYRQQDGFKYWKADAEYLMTEEFISEYLKNINDLENKYTYLMNDWIGSCEITSSFDEAFGCSWPEDNRDIAVSLMQTMIAIYAKYLPQLRDVALHTELQDRIDELAEIQEKFKFITDLENVMQSTKKPMFLDQ